MPAPPLSAGPYGATAPVHHPPGYDPSDEDSYRESIWKDFPPLKLPPVHLPASSHQVVKQANGHSESKQNGHNGHSSQQTNHQASEQTHHQPPGQCSSLFKLMI